MYHQCFFHNKALMKNVQSSHQAHPRLMCLWRKIPFGKMSSQWQQVSLNNLLGFLDIRQVIMFSGKIWHFGKCWSRKRATPLPQKRQQGGVFFINLIQFCKIWTILFVIKSASQSLEEWNRLFSTSKLCYALVFFTPLAQSHSTHLLAELLVEQSTSNAVEPECIPERGKQNKHRLFLV